MDSGPTGDRTERSYGDRVLVIGDAAAQVDPLTGEGIHTAMVAARIAAGVAREMFANNSFSSSATAVYERRWHEEMGPEFLYSRMMAWILVQAPWILDSMAVVGSRRGQSFLDEFGEAMTGVKSKISLLRPGNAIEMVPEILKRLLFGPQAVPKGIPVVEGYQDSGAGIEEMFGRKGR
jgi:flavin-dependent dehydrogenase